MSSRRVLLPLAILLLAGLAPFAQAQTQLLSPPSVTPQPDAASVYPGDLTNFTITVGNLETLQRDMTLSALDLPHNWTATFATTTLSVPGGSARNTTLTIGVPATQAPAGPFAITVRAADQFGTAGQANVSVTVNARPTPTPTPAPTTQPPTLSLGVSGDDEGASGETVEALLTITNADAIRDGVRVDISISGSPDWQPRLQQPTFRVLARGASASIPIFADVPLLKENTTQTFTLTARTEEGYSFTVGWPVRGIAPPAAPVSASTQSATGSGSATSPTRAAPTPALEVLVQPLELRIGPGETAEGVFTLRNTGALPLRLTLQGTSPAEWKPIAWETTLVEILPGDARDVRFTIEAPLGLPLGGTATGQLSASGDGILRTTQYHARIVAPSAPRQEATTARVEVPAPPDGALPQAGAPVALVLGLGTIGAGAAAIAHRPTREKILWLGIGLYTRLARPDVLGHEERERLYRLVETQPGIHFHALQRDLAWNTGTLTYHLRVLERHGFLVSRRDGLYRRFYLSGAAPRKEVFENAGPTGLRADVLEAVKNSPGISQSDLALGLGANKQTVNYHVKALERTGVIRVEKRGRDTYLYPATSPAHGPGFAQA